MSLVSEPRRQCDICKVIEGDSVGRIATIIYEDHEDQTADQRLFLLTLDYCPPCLKRLLAGVKKATSPPEEGTENHNFLASLETIRRAFREAIQIEAGRAAREATEQKKQDA